MEPMASSDNPESGVLAEYKARLACLRRCKEPGCLGCTEWRNFLPATPEAQLEAVSMQAGRPVAARDFDVVAGTMEPAVEAPRPPAWPEHPAVEAMLALRNASAIDRQRRAAALVLRTVGISDEVFEATALHRDEKYGGEGYHESWAGSVASDVREIFEAALAEILA